MPRKLTLKTIFRAVDRMSKPVSRMQRRIQRFTKRATKGMQRLRNVTRKVAGAIGRVLKKGLQAATVALVAFGVAAAKVIQIGATFDKTLVTAATRFPGKIRKGSEEFAKLEAAARKAGAETEFTATEAAEGLKFLGAAGFEAEQAVASLTDTINFATSSELELGDAARKAVLILGAMGMTSENAAENADQLRRVMDNMKLSTDSAAQEMEDVFEAMRVMAPTATTFGQKIETVSAMVIGMAQAGIQASEAGTAYRNIMLRLADPVGKAKKQIKQLGIQLEDSEGNMLGPIRIMEQFARATEGMGTRQKAAALNVIFGKRAINAATKLIDVGADKLREFGQAAEDSGGTVNSAALAIRDTMGGSLDALKSVIESVIIDIFKLEDKGIKGIVDAITEWIRANKKLIATKVRAFIDELIKRFKEFSKWAKDVKLLDKLKDGFELLAKVIGWVIDNIKPLSALVGTIFAIAAAVEVLNAVMAIMNFVAMANPMVLMFLAIAAVSAFTVGAIIMNWDDIKYFFEEIGRFLLEVFEHLWGFVLDIFNSTIGKIVYGPIHLLIGAYKTIRDAWDPSRSFFANLWDGIVKTFEKAWAQIKEIAGDIKGFFEFLFLPGKYLEKVGISADVSPPDQGNPKVVSPGERSASFFEEKNLTTTNKSELTIKDETGRAEVTGGTLGTGISMEPTGGFYE